MDEMEKFVMKQSRYHKDVSAYDMIDVYDVLRLYEVESHPVGHAIKKLLMAGRRGAKDYRQDLQEAVQSIQREIDTLDRVDDEKRAVDDSGPSWDDAPRWARYLAQDANGTWWWYEQKPQLFDDFWWSDTGLVKEYLAQSPSFNWEYSIQQRLERNTASSGASEAYSPGII